MRTLAIAVVAALTAAFALPAGAAQEPWPKDMPGHTPVRPGEHPRLLFRKSDLPRLRARARTPEGEAMLRRLRVVLDGRLGTSMPENLGMQGPAGRDGSGDFSKAPAGSVFTISHVVGYGLLYQMTGEQKFADLGREAMEAAFAGHRGRDRRYAFKAPHGALRAGPSLGWTAVGYDLCYDGWDEAYRRKVCEAIENYNEGSNMSLAELVRGSRHSPKSNHWGMQVGGGAMAILAIMNDPGVDQGKIDELLGVSSKSMVRNLTEGFGDGGYFTEGDGTGSMSSHIIFLPALQAWRNVAGKDFITPRPNAHWTSLKWLLGTVVRNGQPHFHKRDGYPHNVWNRTGMSGGGYFGIGFGVATPPQKAGWLWFYNQHFKARDAAAGAPFDTVSVFPHHVVQAFVNWPFGLAPVNPAECIPRASVDHKFGYCLFRNRWKDENDIVISVLTKRPRSHTKKNEVGPLWITAFGKDSRWGRMDGDIKHFSVTQDGCAVVKTADGTCLAVDFSEHSGAEGMLVMTGPGAGPPDGPAMRVTAGGQALTLKFLTSGSAPSVQVRGDEVVVGRQTVTVRDGLIVLGNTAGPWQGPTEEAMQAVAGWK